MSSAIQPHNERAAATWGAGGANYDAISRTIADSIEHCIHRLAPQPGERVLDLATGTGWTARVAVAWGARVVGVDIGTDLIKAAKDQARQARLEKMLTMITMLGPALPAIGAELMAMLAEARRPFWQRC